MSYRDTGLSEYIISESQNGFSSYVISNHISRFYMKLVDCHSPFFILPFRIFFPLPFYYSYNSDVFTLSFLSFVWACIQSKRKLPALPNRWQHRDAASCTGTLSLSFFSPPRTPAPSHIMSLGFFIHSFSYHSIHTFVTFNRYFLYVYVCSYT